MKNIGLMWGVWRCWDHPGDAIRKSWPSLNYHWPDLFFGGGGTLHTPPSGHGGNVESISKQSHPPPPPMLIDTPTGKVRLQHLSEIIVVPRHSQSKSCWKWTRSVRLKGRQQSPAISSQKKPKHLYKLLKMNKSSGLVWPSHMQDHHMSPFPPH